MSKSLIDTISELQQFEGTAAKPGEKPAPAETQQAEVAFEMAARFASRPEPVVVNHNARYPVLHS